jgi:hypothetical protein
LRYAADAVPDQEKVRGSIPWGSAGQARVLRPVKCPPEPPGAAPVAHRLDACQDGADLGIECHAALVTVDRPGVHRRYWRLPPSGPPDVQPVGLDAFRLLWHGLITTRWSTTSG